MTPVKLSYRVGGKERGSISAGDNETVVLKTPAGPALAERVVTRPIKDISLDTTFPGGPKQRKERRFRDVLRGRCPPLIREKVYRTEEGTVIVRAEGTEA